MPADWSASLPAETATESFERLRDWMERRGFTTITLADPNYLTLSGPQTFIATKVPQTYHVSDLSQQISS